MTQHVVLHEVNDFYDLENLLEEDHIEQLQSNQHIA